MIRTGTESLSFHYKRSQYEGEEETVLEYILSILTIVRAQQTWPVELAVA